MENSLEFQRRQLWIDFYYRLVEISFVNKHMLFESKYSIIGADNALAEFDKRFPQPTQSGMMDEKEFESWLYERMRILKEKAVNSGGLFDYASGAWAAYNVLTGKE